MPITENNANVSANVTAFSTAFIGLCRALEHQKILMPSAIAQEILAQRNLLKDDSESRNVKQVLDRITKSLQEPATPAISL
jgi:hypothetical protein